MNLADYSYVMDIHPARESQEDYPDVTSDLIIKNLKHGEKITMDDSDKLKDYKSFDFSEYFGRIGSVDLSLEVKDK